MPLRYDLIVDQGADYQRSIPVLADGTDQPTSVTGWTVSGQIRASHWSATVLHVLDLAVDGTDVALRIPAAVSAAWTWRLGRYDVKITGPDGSVTRLLEGSVVVRPEVTRP